MSSQRLRLQPVEATHWLNCSAGVLKSSSSHLRSLEALHTDTRLMSATWRTQATRLGEFQRRIMTRHFRGRSIWHRLKPSNHHTDNLFDGRPTA